MNTNRPEPHNGCEHENGLKRLHLTETVSMRGLTFEVAHEYDKCPDCQTLFEPHEDIDKNIMNDFRTYESMSNTLITPYLYTRKDVGLES